MNVPTFDSQQFNWSSDGHGMAEMSDLLFTTKTWRIPNMFYIKSARTGKEVLFTLDQLAPGYEDGWDGEYKRFTNAERTVKTTIIND